MRLARYRPSLVYLVLAVSCCSGLLFPLGRLFCQAPTGVSAGNGRLILELKTDKGMYKVGEPVLFTIILRNAGKEALWVSKFVGLASIPGAAQLEVTDEQGNKLGGQTPVLDVPLDAYDLEDAFQWIKETRLVLGPGHFLGFTESLQANGFVIRRAGRYCLQARYSDVDLGDLGITLERVEKAKKEAKIPLWSGNLISPRVCVAVYP